MWVYSISKPSLSLICAQTTGIYYQDLLMTDKNGNKQTYTQTEILHWSNKDLKIQKVIPRF